MSQLLDPQARCAPLDAANVIGVFHFETLERYPGGNAREWSITLALQIDEVEGPIWRAQAASNSDDNYALFKKRVVPFDEWSEEKHLRLIELARVLIAQGGQRHETRIWNSRADREDEDSDWHLDLRIYESVDACRGNDPALNVLRYAEDRPRTGTPEKLNEPDEITQAFIDTVFDMTGIGRRVLDFEEVFSGDSAEGERSPFAIAVRGWQWEPIDAMCWGHPVASWLTRPRRRATRSQLPAPAAAPGDPSDPSTWRDCGERYRLSPDSTVVFDTSTQLLWQRHADKNPSSYAEALAGAYELRLCGLSGWRVPTLDELMELVDDSRAYPALDPVAFAGDSAFAAEPGSTYCFWTSTPVPWGARMGVDFAHGEEDRDTRICHLRAVRSLR